MAYIGTAGIGSRNRRVIRDFQEFYEDKQFRIDVPKGGAGLLICSAET